MAAAALMDGEPGIGLAALSSLWRSPSSSCGRWESDPGEGPAAAVVPVIRVVDGDTIEVRLGGRNEDVRLIGVDTPETVSPTRRCSASASAHPTSRNGR